MIKTMSLFPTPSEWMPPQGFPDLSEAKEIAIDLETCDPNLEKYGPGWPRKDGYIIGYAVAVDGWQGYYPVAHQGGGNLDKRIVENFIKQVLLLPCDKIMHNAAYDCGWLMAQGFEIKGRVIDTMLAAAVLDENRFSYSLNALGFEYLKQTKSEQGLREAAADFGVNPKKDMWKLPAMYVGAYAEQDAALTLKLWHHFQTLLRREEVESIFDLETELLPVLIDLTYKGIQFDRDKASRLIDQMQDREKKIMAEIKKSVGVGVDIWAAASVAIAFDKQGIQYPRSKTNLPSFTKTFLETCYHPLAKLIVEAREINKTYGTFLQPYLEFSAADGRIHPHVNQLRSDTGGTVTGRLCVHGDTILETSRGNFRIEDYIPSGHDLILTHRGRYRKILRKFLKGTEQMLKITLENGASVTCTAGHRMLTKSGWKHLRDIKQGEEIFSNVDQQSRFKKHPTRTGSGESIHCGREANATRISAAIQHYLSHRNGHGSHQPLQRTDSSRENTTVLKGQGWGAQPHARKEGGITSWVQRHYFRWKEAFAYFAPGLVYVKARLQACFLAPSGFLPSFGDYGNSSGFCYTPYRRGSVQQRDTQPRTSDDQGTCPYSSSKVREILVMGEARVWDIEVEEDHSYVAGGLVHHNSMASPNLQQVPARHPVIGPAIRSLFLPEEGQLWASNDFSSQEPRILVHYASLLGLPGVDKVVQSYKDDPDTDFHQMVADMAGIDRKQAKVLGLSITYGAGKNKIAAQLELPVDEAGEIIRDFHTKVPFLRGTIDAVMRRIEHPASGGCIRTLLGRKCRFPLFEPVAWGINKALPYEQAVVKYGPRVKRAMTYKGLNRLIQGSAADQTKAAMLRLHKAGFNILLQVHDELALSVNNREEAEEAAQLMCQAADLEVPSRVDVEIGPSWGEAV